MDSNVKKQIDTLNAQWRNTLAKAMGMDVDGNFQIAQGDLGLSSTDSSGLFLMSDAVPPCSAAAYYAVDYSNRRSSGYGSLLTSLLPEGGQDLVDVLGDMYTPWINYKAKAITDGTDLNQEQLFEKWSDLALDPRKKQQALTVFKKAANAPLNVALDAYADKNNKQEFMDSASKSYKLYKYSSTIDNAKKAINTGASIDNLVFDSTKAESKLNKTFVEGGASGFYSIFSGGAGASFESLNAKAANAKITMEGKVNKFATVPTGPIGWYESNEVNKGFNNKDNHNVWDPNAQQGWNDFFAQPDGALSRYVDQMLLVSGYEVTVNIHAGFSQEDFEQIKTKASFGVWPFFSASAETTHTSDYKLAEDGTLSYTVKSNPGDVKIWGVTFKAFGEK
jgi:hypothetical protein